MLIPAGVRHQYLNFTNDVVRAYVAIGPGLWPDLSSLARRPRMLG
jgi:hypothetical protein